jgi:GTP cyclohydrolase II
MEMIEEAGKGVIVYMRQEGRGIGSSTSSRPTTSRSAAATR